MTPEQILAHTEEQKRKWDWVFAELIADTDKFIAWLKFGRCGNAAGSEDKGNNTQRPIQNSCGSTEGRASSAPVIMGNIGEHPDAKMPSSIKGSGYRVPPAGTEFLEQSENGVGAVKNTGRGCHDTHMRPTGERSASGPVETCSDSHQAAPAGITLLPCATCPWRVDKDSTAIPRYVHDKACGLMNTVGRGDDFRPIMACHHSGQEMFACKGYLAMVGWTNLNVRLLLAKGQIENPTKVLKACEAAGIELHSSYQEVLAKLSASAGCYGSGEPTADDGEEGYLDEEPYWSDSDTTREMYSDKGVK